jgi:hypothetical protein
MTDPLRRQIAEAFRQEESAHEVPPGLRDEVVGAAADRRSRTPGAPRLLALVAVLLAGAVIATLVGLRHLSGQSTPAANPTAVPSAASTPTPSPSAASTGPPVQFTTAHLTGGVPARGQVAVAFTETGLSPGQSVSYRVTGQLDLLYDCGFGGPGGPSYPVRGPVDFTVTRTADAQGTVAATISIPPQAGAPACTPPTRPATVTGDWTNFVVEDTTSGIREPAGSLNVAT